MTGKSGPGSNATIGRAEKKKLLVRIGIAGVLIIALIGALALFEQQQKPEQAEPESLTSPAPAQSLPVPEPQNQASGSIPPSAGPEAKSEPLAEPERTAAPQVAGPAAPEKGGGRKSESEKLAAPPVEDTHPRLVVGKGGEPPAAPKTPPQAPVSRPATLESPPVVRAITGTGFLVQVGVFSNLGNAEELRKKLADAGIPAQIEARVQVGPFATQAEAAAAQNKLRSLGMDPGMVLPPRR